MIKRILLAVDDTPDSLAAARFVIGLAAVLHSEVLVLHVQADHTVDEALRQASSRPFVPSRRVASGASVLSRISKLADKAGIKVEIGLLSGEVAPTVLEKAQVWNADLVVVGKSTRSASGQPYVGTQTRRVLEFSDKPVLVVPAGRSQADLEAR